MAIEISTLSIKVQSNGIAENTRLLDGLATSADKAEKSTDKLATNAVASAKKQAKESMAAWTQLQNELSKAREKEYNDGLAHNNRLYTAALKEANRINRISQDRLESADILAQKAREKEYTDTVKQYTKLFNEADKSAIRQQKLTQKRLEEDSMMKYQAAQKESAAAKAQVELTDVLKHQAATKASIKLKEQLQAEDILKHEARAKEYANAQAEALRMNALRDANYAKALADAERQRLLNARFSTSSLPSQISTLTRASAYGASGGNVVAQFGSDVAAKANAASIRTLTEEHARLEAASKKSGSAIQQHNVFMQDAHAAVRGLSGSLGMLWMTYGNAVPLVAGAAIGASFKQVISQGMLFEDIVQGIGVKGQETAENINKLRETALQLGQGVYGPQQVAGALETLILAGLKAEQAVRGVGAALNLATVGGTSIEKAAYTLVQVGTAMGYTSDSFSVVGDVIAKTAAASMSSVESLSEAFKSASSVGVVYGVTLKDLAVNLATLSNLGIQGSAAGTAVKNMYKELDGGGKKVVETLKAIGVSVDRDLKVDGKFKDLSSIVSVLSGALDKLGDQGGKGLQRITNERGLRSMAALLQAYRSEAEGASSAFADLTKQIDDSAGFTAIGAAQRVTTAKNQMESTLNSLKTTFIETFESMSPQLTIVASQMKDLFKSEEFTSGLRNVVTGLSNFFVLLATNVPTIIHLAEAFLAVKAAMFAVNVASAAVQGWRMLVPLLETALGTTLSLRVAMTGLVASMGPIALVLTAVGAAFAYYNYQKHDALDTSTQDAATKSNEAFSNSLAEEAKRLEVANKNLRENTSAKEANAKTTRELALAEVQSRNNSAIGKAQEQYNTSLGKIGSIFSPHAAEDAIAAKNELARVREQATKDYNIAVAQLDKVQALSKENDNLSQAKIVADEQRNKKRAELAASLAGNPTLPEAPDKNAVKIQNAYESELLKLKQLTDGYRERTAAVQASGDSEVRVLAHVYAEREKDYILAKHITDTKRSATLMAEANAADEAKFAQEKANAVTEQQNKVTKVLQEAAAYERTKNERTAASVGLLEAETIAVLKYNGASKERIALEAARAHQADIELKAREARVKLTNLTAANTQAADTLREEADLMMEFGIKTKASAVALAEFQMKRLGISKENSPVQYAASIDAAALKDLNTAYKSSAQIIIDSTKAIADAEAEGKLVFVESEAEKVRIKAAATKKLLAYDLMLAKSALDKSAASNGGVASEQALADYAKAVKTNNEAIAADAAKVDAELNTLKLKDWKKTVSDIEQMGRDGFMAMFEKGTSGWKAMTDKFKSMFKTTVLDYIYKQFAKPFVLQVIASVTGAMGMSGLSSAASAMGGGATSGSSVGGLIGLASNASSMYKALTGGIASTLGGGMVALGNTLGLSAVSSFGAGMVAPSATAALAEGVAGPVLAGTAAGMGAAVAAAIPWVAGALAIGSLWNSAFGHGSTETRATGIRGTVGMSGTSGESYAVKHEDGGWFRGDNNWTETSKLSNDVLNQFTNGLVSMKASSTDLAKNLNVTSSVLDNYSKAFNVAMGSDSAANQKAITEFFTTVGDDMATKLIPNIANFSKVGETASVTLQRLSDTFKATDQIAAILGKDVSATFGGIGLSSDKAREYLVSLAGSISNLSSKVAAYSSAFLTDAEKIAPVQKAVSAAMSSLGYSSITTKDQFKSLVNSLNLTNEAQATLFNNLMDLAPAFAQVADYNTAAAEAATKAAEDTKNAWQSASDSLVTEIQRIRGLVAGNSASSLNDAQRQFNTAASAAQGGNLDAAKSLPALSQALLTIAETQAHSLLELNSIRSATANKLQGVASYSSSSYGTTIPSFDVGTNEVTHDTLALVHQGERIMPKADNAELKRRLAANDEDGVSNADVVNAVKELGAIITAGDLGNIQITREMMKLIRKWDLDGMPDVRDIAA